MIEEWFSIESKNIFEIVCCPILIKSPTAATEYMSIPFCLRSLSVSWCNDVLLWYNSEALDSLQSPAYNLLGFCLIFRTGIVIVTLFLNV
jgi:hypothetical protein